MRVSKTDFFDSLDGSIENTVFLLRCDPHRDDRGCFTETYCSGVVEGQFADLSWCKQINCSTSNPYVFRGFHAQVGKDCQGKMVECLLGSVTDIIIDIRPNSNSFGKYMAVELKASEHEKLWVPKGFLHGFFSNETPLFTVGKRPDGNYAMRNGQNIFNYMVDAPYNKASEVTIDPRSVFAFLKPNGGMDDTFLRVKAMVDAGRVMFSKKDESGMDLRQCLSVIMTDYKNTGLLWYADNSDAVATADGKARKEPEEVIDEGTKSEKWNDVVDGGIEEAAVVEETVLDGDDTAAERERRAILPELPHSACGTQG